MHKLFRLMVTFVSGFLPKPDNVTERRLERLVEPVLVTYQSPRARHRVKRNDGKRHPNYRDRKAA